MIFAELWGGGEERYSLLDETGYSGYSESQDEMGLRKIYLREKLEAYFDGTDEYANAFSRWVDVVRPKQGRHHGRDVVFGNGRTARSDDRILGEPQERYAAGRDERAVEDYSYLDPDGELIPGSMLLDEMRNSFRDNQTVCGDEGNRFAFSPRRGEN